ncbi:nucleotidyltransferase family protein [bacterium]
MYSFIEIIQILQENKKTLAKYKVKKLGIFGSYVKGEQKEESDIDILVEFEPDGKDLFNYLRLQDYLETILNKKVDLIIKEAIKTQLKDVILNEVKYA